MLRLVLRRLLSLPIQIFGLITLVFFLTRMIPGDPAYALAGGQATDAQIERIRADLGLDQPLIVQFGIYLKGLLLGDWGTSLQTSSPVIEDLLRRLPATLLLMGGSLLVIVIVAIILLAVTISRPQGVVRRFVSGYGFFAGVVPDFWIGLGLISLLYVPFGIGASPNGQLDGRIFVPNVTGVGLFDAILASDPYATTNAFMHLFLPVLTLVIVYLAPIIRIMTVVSREAAASDFVRYADSWGISPLRRVRYILRYTAPQLTTVLASTTVFLLGGAVLVETVFSWGGLGQYAVNAVTRSDYAAVQGFVLVAGVFTALVYLINDVLHFAIDPQLRKAS